jgi:hypothetical protein
VLQLARDASRRAASLVLRRAIGSRDGTKVILQYIASVHDVVLHG